MSWMNNLFPPVSPAAQVDVGGAKRVNPNFFVTGKTPEVGSADPYAQYDIPLLAGHNGSNQYTNQAGYEGVMNTIWVG